ncbi:MULTISPECIES: ABC-2 transporter permease [unclassified Francisella]|uniref:ABC-2 transporter permease n=1 Tax=unclassified Francisella TaxID=2610885 RepID=UPI002E33A468|nr:MULTISPECIES: ABC-2 transporter permease [unclassified Francisella]MED7819969.1 ABC-2 transporter permease [Francisella sp. 19S2-4]MED7830809.1 ABC-2 transporter permease [Francisella sp. 19S2-10]
MLNIKRNKFITLKYIIVFILFSIVIGHFLAAIALGLYAIQQYLLKKFKLTKLKLWEIISSIAIILVAIVIPIIYKAGYTTTKCDNVKETLSEILIRENNNSFFQNTITLSNFKQVDFFNNTRTCQANVLIDKKPIENIKYIIENKGFNRNLVKIISLSPL